MAKLKKSSKSNRKNLIPNQKNKKKQVTEITQVTIPLKIISSNNIAYKIPCSDFILETSTNKISQDKELMFPNESDPKPEDLELLGFQFKFNKEINNDGIDLGFMETYKIYFSNSTHRFYKTPDPFLILNSSDKVYYIDEYKIGMNPFTNQDNLETSHYELKLDSDISEINGVYRKLDHYDEKIEFVYFTIDQLLPFFCFYDEIIISGCRIKMEKKLTPIKAEGNLYDDLYFSLKVEGYEFKNGLELNYKDTENRVVENAEGPGALIGYPCPPVWHTVSVLTGQAFESIAKKQKTGITRKIIDKLAIHSQESSPFMHSIFELFR